jgi:hypothetical protein
VVGRRAGDVARVGVVVLEVGDDLLAVVHHVQQPVVRVQDAAVRRLQTVHRQPRAGRLRSKRAIPISDGQKKKECHTDKRN